MEKIPLFWSNLPLVPGEPVCLNGRLAERRRAEKEAGCMKEKLSPAAQAEKSEQSKGQKGSRLPTSP